MTDTIFESFSEFLEQADYPQGKKRIMAAAVELFASQGYNGTSTARIAQQAGLSQATLFKHFKSKDELLTAILHPVVSGLFANFLDELLAQNTIQDMVRFLVRDRMTFLGANRDLIKIILQETLIDNRLKEEQRYIMENLQTRLEILYQRLQRDEMVNDTLALPQVIRIFIGPIIAYFGQLYILTSNGKQTEEDLLLVEQQILRVLKK